MTIAKKSRPENSGTEVGGVDVITTELIRQGLISAAYQMREAVIRSAFSPIIHEALDFAVAIYDREFRLLSQAPTLLISLRDDAMLRHVERIRALGEP